MGEQGSDCRFAHRLVGVLDDGHDFAESAEADESGGGRGADLGLGVGDGKGQRQHCELAADGAEGADGDQARGRRALDGGVAQGLQRRLAHLGEQIASRLSQGLVVSLETLAEGGDGVLSVFQEELSSGLGKSGLGDDKVRDVGDGLGGAHVTQCRQGRDAPRGRVGGQYLEHGRTHEVIEFGKHGSDRFPHDGVAVLETFEQRADSIGAELGDGILSRDADAIVSFRHDLNEGLDGGGRSEPREHGDRAVTIRAIEVPE